MEKLFQTELGSLYNTDSLKVYEDWDTPTVIISDGPYGIDGYIGDAKKPDDLKQMYEPHIKAWSKAASSQTTLWFWNTEVGWANVHQTLVDNGWIYRGLNIWDKGIEHIAGNCNGKTMRKFPTVTEVCAHYVRKDSFHNKNGIEVSLQNWLRQEWERTGLSLNKANEACGVKSAASRKYLTKDHLWYFPPSDVFEKLVNYANEHGLLEGKPYFSINGLDALNANQWERMRAKFFFEYGVTNVWKCAALRSQERLKNGSKLSHPNQKPLELMNRIILASSETNDIVWEPFAGTASASFSAMKNDRRFFAAEISEDYFLIAKNRLSKV